MWRESAAAIGIVMICTGAGWTQTPADSNQPPATTSPPTTETFGRQTVPPPSVAAPPTVIALSGFSEDYRVGTGDQLEIQVVGHGDLNQTLRISNTGEISYPSLGLIKVTDLTVFDVEAVIADKFREKQLILQPEVLVFVREYQAKKIYVTGAVTNPGEFIMSRNLTVMEALLLAGGLEFNAADQALIHRRQSQGAGAAVPVITDNPSVPAPGVEIVTVDLTPLKQGRLLEQTVTLEQGDVLVVPETRMNPFFVVGEVITPQNYYYRPGRDLLVSQAISWAGGPTPTAKLSDGMLVRYDALGNREELNVDYQAILEGRQEDFAIQPYDIIFIPGSKLRTLSVGLLGLTDTMVMQATFRVGRTYQLPDAPRDQEPR